MSSTVVQDAPVRLARAAAELNVSTWTLRAWCRNGRLRYLRLGNLLMVERQEIERLLRESSIEAHPS